jgi:magnesium-transporting ATPase (P-type)
VPRPTRGYASSAAFAHESSGGALNPPEFHAVAHPQALPAEDVLATLRTTERGLSAAEAHARLARVGRNALPRVEPPGLATIVLRQFASPLIYVLLVAAAVSALLRDWADAGFIFAVLLINAAIGAFQEAGAQRSAEALRKLVSLRSLVERDGETYDVDATDLVPGDIVLLESGTKVPADLRLFDAHNLETDESLLTGESLPATKDAKASLGEDCRLADRTNMAFAGTMVISGRGRGVVVATGTATALGGIAASVLERAPTPPPLITRMERFTYRVALVIGVAALGLVVVSLLRGTPFGEVFVLAVALAVSAIPEGLPVALTVALAVATERMARRNVIVRQLVAVEALGSCTCIASDKTGTLTINRLTVRRVQFPDQPAWEVTGEGLGPEGTLVLPEGASRSDHEGILDRLCRAVVLPNEATVANRDGEWVGTGDPVDVALLVMARKAGVPWEEAKAAAPVVATIPYEPASKFAASLNRRGERPRAAVKGALDALLTMCDRMATASRDVPILEDLLRAQETQLAGNGYRVLAVADGEVALAPGERLTADHLRGLTLLGLVGMTDPLRPEARDAIDACRRAGIRVAMVTGDHTATALVIARDLGIASHRDDVVTGADLAEARESGEGALDLLCAGATVFARVEPQQKLDIVQALQRDGHFVAVTGDGVNDAPALHAAQVGVAMGKTGTDVARETADLIVTDDNFASVVAGIEEGRIAYGNIRKVIFLLISTGAAEIVLFMLALGWGLPLPLVAVQLLWLNLVTNGIQDVALAFEPAEGDELDRPPRPPREPIFNRLMLERVVLSAVVMGGLAFAAYRWLLGQGLTVEDARNATLLLMVLFENVQAFNSRSETRSVFTHSPLRNKLLLFGIVVALLVHVGAMYVPWLAGVLAIRPAPAAQWLPLLLAALVLLVAMEAYKVYARRAHVAP